MALDGSNIVGQAEGYAVWPKNFQAFQAIVDAFEGFLPAAPEKQESTARMAHQPDRPLGSAGNAVLGFRKV